MPLILADRVKESSTTAGTGTLTLAGAAGGFRSFAAIGNGNTTYYTIVDNTTGAFEVGIGTYTASGTTLSRDIVLSNSLGTTALISFAANAKDVFVTYPAKYAETIQKSTTYLANAAPDNGLWLNSNSADTKVLYNDGTNRQWVSVNSGLSGVALSFDGGVAAPVSYNSISQINGGTA